MEMAAAPKFKLDGLRRHKMLTAEDVKRLPALGTTDGQGDEATVQVKYFCPYNGRHTILVTEWDGEDTLYGYVISPLGQDCDEWGYSSLSELANAAGMGGKLPLIERDCYFEPVTVGAFKARTGLA